MQNYATLFDRIVDQSFILLLWSIFVKCSGEQTTSKKKVTSRKRRQNQNAEIDELASLVSLPTPPQPPSSGDSNPSHSLVPSCGSTPSAVDKISVLRLTTTFLKLHDFMKSGE